MADPFVAPTVTVYAGDSLVFPVYQICDSEEDPIDLSAWTWKAQWRKTPTSSAAIELAVDSSESSSGIFKITATPQQTNDMGTSGVWDLQGTLGALVETWIRGETAYTKDVTR
jgi:hypothetical protein